MPDSNLTPVAIKAAKANGIPVNLFLALGGQESGGSQTHGGKVTTSPAGAQGWGQLMPGTAKGLGVDPTDPAQNIEGSARYLKQQFDTFKSWRLALAAYNAGPNAVREHGNDVPPYKETVDYVHRILAAAGGFKTPAGGTAGLDLSGGATSAATPTAPDLSGLADLASGTYDPLKQEGDLLAAQSAPEAPGANGEAVDASSPAPVQAAAPEDLSKWYSLGRNADRPGVPTQPAVLDFVGQLGATAGEKLTIGTGSNHHRMTQDGLVSDHWSGEAADVPAAGDKLLNLGYLALVQAGMPPAEAKKKRDDGGGLFNVGGYQIIFGNYPGHSTHLHVGIRKEDNGNQ